MTDKELQTINNVKAFMKRDFWHYINLGGIHPNMLKSADFTNTPTGTTNINSNENNLVSTLDKADKAQYIAITILLALNDCSDFDYEKRKTILYKIFIDRLTQEQVGIRLNFSNYQLRQQLQQGCIEFAERLEYWKCKRSVQELPTLLIE